jgi:hypothetical protein
MLVNVGNSFIKIHQFIKFNDGCFSAMSYYKNGSLLVSFYKVLYFFVRSN